MVLTYHPRSNPDRMDIGSIHIPLRPLERHAVSTRTFPGLGAAGILADSIDVLRVVLQR